MILLVQDLNSVVLIEGEFKPLGCPLEYGLGLVQSQSGSLFCLPDLIASTSPSAILCTQPALAHQGENNYKNPL